MSLVIERVTFGYRDRPEVLKDFSATFPSGQITGLTGNNGVGKTTLAKIIVGILKCQRGKITVDGVDITGKSPAFIGCHVGYVMQRPSVQIFSNTVEEEVRYGLKNLGLPEEEINSRTDKYLGFFRLEKKKGDFPFTLSQGEKQRLVLAAVLAMEPPYLVLDEPTASLDVKGKETLGQYLKDLKKGVIVISHDMDFVEKYCHSQVRMEAAFE